MTAAAEAGAGRDDASALLVVGVDVGARLVRAGAALGLGDAPVDTLAPDGFWTGLSTVTSTGGSS
ncbi:MAG: hypothetical protein WBV18_13615 [Methyloceanibacter sp.]|uniref:hypothetical protein n=1 Tax=Methyloceanibacter sp. TaxID=1965321 RepID=UPI003C4E2FE9